MAEVEIQDQKLQSAPEPRRTRRLGWLIALLALVSAAGFIGYEAWQREQARPYDQLHSNLAAIQLEIERYAVDNEGSYPARLEELVELEYITDWPSNPFRPDEPMPILQSGEASQPGGIVYEATKQVFIVSEVRLDEISSEHELLRLPTAREPGIEVQDYFLCGYGSRSNPDGWRGTVFPSGIAWEHVHCFAFAGEDISCNDG